MVLLLTPADCGLTHSLTHSLTEDRIPEPPPLLTQEILSPWADAAHPPTPISRPCGSPGKSPDPMGRLRPLLESATFLYTPRRIALSNKLIPSCGPPTITTQSFRLQSTNDFKNESDPRTAFCKKLIPWLGLHTITNYQIEIHIP